MRLSQFFSLSLYVIFFCFSALPLYSQEYLANIQYFGIEDGLSHRDVYDIHQDKKGFIWVGTKYGLNRFDGYEFKWYTKEKNGLNSNTVHHILEDSEGDLWLFESYNWYYFDDIQAVSILDSDQDTIQTFKEKFGEKSLLKPEEIEFAVSSPDGQLYFGLRDGGLVSYNPQTGWKTIIEKEGMAFEPKLYSSNHTIWGVGEDFQLIELDTLGQIIQRIDLKSKIELEQDTRIFISNEDHDGNIWLCVFLYSKPYILKIGIDDSSFSIEDFWGEQFITENPFPNLFYQKASDVFWYAGIPKLMALDSNMEELFDFAAYYPELSAGEIHDIYFDGANRAWIGTFYGLFLVQFYKSPFKRYLYYSNSNQPSSDFYSCRGILAADSIIFINSYKGLQVVSMDGGEPSKIPELRWANKYSEQDRYLVLPHAMIQTASGNYLFGDEGLVLMDPENHTFQVFPYINNDIGGSVWSIHEDKNGKIWFGTERGIGFLDTVNKVCKPMNLPAPYRELNDSKINFIGEGNGDTLYLATSTGLYVLDTQKGILGKYWSEAKGKYCLPADDIRHFYIDSHQQMWLATYGGGLVKLDLKREVELNKNNHSSQKNREMQSHFQQYTIADGLSNNNLYAIYEDDYNNFWLSSDYGIIVFNKESHQSQAFLPEDGITHHEFNTISHFQAEDGRLYFGSLNGVTAFYPADVLKIKKPFDMPLVVRGLQQFDKSIGKIVDKSQAFQVEKSVTLRPGEHFFDLKFALLTYGHMDKVRYMYRIERLQNNWTYTSEPSIRFGGLAYGNHILHIRAQGPDGRFSQEELKIPIYVLSPIYLRWWFQGLVISVFLIAAILYYQQRTHFLQKRQLVLKKAVEEGTKIIREQNERLLKDKTTIEKQAEELRHLDKMKSRFFANISHELRTPLTLLLGPISSMLKQDKLSFENQKLLKIAQKNGQQLISLIEEILDLSRIEANKLKLEMKTVKFYPLIRQIITSFEAMANIRNMKFIFEYQADSELHLELDEKKFQKILNNLLSNAFKYTPDGGLISLIVEDRKNRMHLRIKDSGRGIHPADILHIFDRFFQSKQENTPAEGGTGIGLALVKEFITLMDGKVWVESELEKGSTFFLEFPKKEVMGGIDSLTIPVYKKFTENLGAKETLHIQRIDSSKETILVVEDHIEIQQYVHTILGEKYQLNFAMNGKEALDWLNEVLSSKDHGNFRVLPSMIISDVMMPIMDGFQLLEELKKHPSFMHIPTVMLTAKAGIQNKMQALRMGVDDYILKPFEEEELIVRIESLLNNANSRQKYPPLTDTQDREVRLSNVDTKWLAEQEIILKEKLKDSNFNVSQWADFIHMSERNLQRKLKQLTGLSPLQYMMEIRLQEGRKILELKTHQSLSEIAYEVGFANPRSFQETLRNDLVKILQILFNVAFLHSHVGFW